MWEGLSITGKKSASGIARGKPVVDFPSNPIHSFGRSSHVKKQ